MVDRLQIGMHQRQAMGVKFFAAKYPKKCTKMN